MAYSCRLRNFGRLAAFVPRPGCRLPAHRAFATAVFNLPQTKSSAREQVLFLLGLNEKKFFGKDSSEEGLKLLERIAEHDSKYHLLLGVPPLTLEHVTKNHLVKDRRLTSSRKLEAEVYGEMIPLLQASMLDSRPRFALDRPKRITAERLALELSKLPREGARVYWAWFKRNTHKDAMMYEFWSKHFPVCSEAYFNQRAEHIALSALEHIVETRAKGHSGSALLVVNNDIYALVTEVLQRELAADAKLDSSDCKTRRQKKLKELSEERFEGREGQLVFHVLFIYVGIPGLVLVNLQLLADMLWRNVISPAWGTEVEDRE
mmetsp:Transcript_58374/g.107757  ORF Transcript_58374/g.107757 Transcript_58374/m.107757 type:complete len:319 (+) Transcript_58374:115-1071(+)